MKVIFTIILLTSITFPLRSQNASWLVGEWQGTIIPNNETLNTKKSIKLIAEDEYNLTIQYTDSKCEDIFKLISKEDHRLIFTTSPTAKHYLCTSVNKLTINLMDNNYISIEFQTIYERFTETVGSARLKKN